MKGKNSSRTQLIRRLVQLGFALFILVTAIVYPLMRFFNRMELEL